MLKSKSLTLIETMVAALVFVTLALSCAMLLKSGLNLRAKISSQQEVRRQLNIKLEILARQLRNAIDFYKGSDTGFRGEANAIEFYTLAYDYLNNSPKIIKLNYSFDGSNLTQRINPVFGGDSAKEDNKFILSVSRFQFTYFEKDSLEPLLVWNNNKALPCVVKISLLYAESGSELKRLEKLIYIKR